MPTVEELEKQLAQARRKEVQEALHKKERYAQSLIGRCYKRVDGYGRYSKSQKVNTDHGTFIKVLGISETGNDKNNFSTFVHRVDILCTPVGWVRNKGVIGLDGHLGLRYQMDMNEGSMSKTPRKIIAGYGSELRTGNHYEWNRIEFSGGNEDGSVLHTTGSGWVEYIQCDESEMLWVEDKLAEMSKTWYETFRHLFTKEKGVRNPISPETEGIITQFDAATIKAIDDLLNANPNLDLQSLITVAKKETKYNYFNGIRLPELVQYTIEGDHGLSLEIIGGDGGTDYEPYTTHYYIGSVHIDWPHILYPIRKKLSCGVYELTEKLSNLVSVYSPSSWDCHYDTYGYDASFMNARLQEWALNDINTVIAAHIKN